MGWSKIATAIADGAALVIVPLALDAGRPAKAIVKNTNPRS